MNNVSKQIYRKIEELLPELSELAPYNRVNLADIGLPDINAVVFESLPNRISFILSRHVSENGKSIASPCFEIAANPKMKIANVVTYKDDHYFHDVVPKPIEVGMMAQSQVNSFLYQWLMNLKGKALAKCIR